MKILQSKEKAIPLQLQTRRKRHNSIMKRKWTAEKEHLENEILNENKSYEEIGREYGCTGSNIKKVARRLGIELPKKRKLNPNETFSKRNKIHICINCGKEFNHVEGNTNKYCSSICEKEYKHKQKYQLILNGDNSIMRANYSPKAFRDDILKEQDGVCAICGMNPLWNGKKLIFIIDHIDGHASNNKRENLRCVCPNCDSQLDTYKSKNKYGERHYYRYRNNKEGS